MKELLNKLDTNNNGFIDYTEFIAGCLKSKIYLKEEHLRNAFSYFDKVNLRKIIPILMLIAIGSQWYDIKG